MITNDLKISPPVRRPSFIRFGTDGWRGIIAEEYTFQNVRQVAHAVAQTFHASPKKQNKVFIGYDHRFLAEHFAKEVYSILRNYHYLPALLSEPVTSPFLSFITWKEQAPFGVMITASHNPCSYLGFKVKASFGGSILQDTALKIEEKLSSVDASQKIPPDSSEPVLPDQKAMINAKTNYTKYLKDHIETDLFKKSDLKIGFDFLYGPGGKFIEDFFDSIPHHTKYSFIHNNRDPLFGGLHPEPIEHNLEIFKTFVLGNKLSLGCALDGDGDRLGVVDDHGRYLTPQQVYSLLLFYLLNEKKLKGKIVQTVSLGYLSERIARDFNCPFEEVPVGFKYIAKELLKGETLAGGEESGGFAFAQTKPSARKGELLPERDGILSALLLIETVLYKKLPLSKLLQELQKRYGKSEYLREDIYLPAPVKDKDSFVRKMQNNFPKKWLGMKVKEMKTADGLKIKFEDGSWLLIRLSGTEPLLRTYCEFPKRELAKNTLEKLSLFIKEEVGLQ